MFKDMSFMFGCLFESDAGSQMVEIVSVELMRVKENGD